MVRDRLIRTVALCLLLFSAAPVDPTSAQNYTNPVSSSDTPRPFIVRDGSYYYSFSGKTRIPVRRSTNLTSWTSLGDSIISPGSWASGWGNDQSAAVWKVGSTWVMYYTAKSATENRSCIGVATATAPDGPYTAQSTPIVCVGASNVYRGASDANVFLNGPSGSPTAQLVWVGHDNSTGDPTMIWSQPLASNGLSLSTTVGPSKLLDKQANGWEGGTIGSPVVVYDPSTSDTSFAKIYLLYSGNGETSKEHAMAWASCSTNATTGALSLCRREVLGTWLDSETDAMAPGDAAIFTDGSSSWLVYSAYAGSCNPATGVCSGTRSMRIDKLCFQEGMPRSNGPSTTAQAFARVSSCASDVATHTVDSVGSLTIDSLAALPPTPYRLRDDGVSAVVGGRSLWVFGDTFGCSFSHAGSSVICSNTSATVTAPSAANPPFSATENPGPGTSLLIPYTTAELADANFGPLPPSDYQRIAHWPSAVQRRNDGTALVYFNRIYSSDANPLGPFQDTGIACVSLDGTCQDPNTLGYANVTRLGEVFDDTEGSFNEGVVVRGNYAYLYSWNPVYGAPIPFSVARVPVGQEVQRSSYTFFDGSGWSTDIGDAVAADGMVGGGTVAFNPYLGKYLSIGQRPGEIFFPNGTEQYLTIQTADAPEGPWSDVLDIPVGQSANSGPNYHFLEHAELAMQRGKTILVSYFHPVNAVQARIFLLRITFP